MTATGCPSCGRNLRELEGRLVCEACGDALCSRSDVETAVGELFDVRLRLALVDERAGGRRCPRCGVPMTVVRLRVSLDERELEIAEPGPDAEQCSEHGLWFTLQELADALAPYVALELAPDRGSA